MSRPLGAAARLGAHSGGLLGGLLGIVGGLLAQSQPPNPPQGGDGVRVDAVVATVNDSPILLSQLQAAIAGRLRVLRSRGATIVPQQVDMITREALQQLVNNHRLAQAAKTFGQYTPDQVESIVTNEIERDKDQQRRDLGSTQAVSRELKRQGRNWSDVEQEKRTETLAAFARSVTVHQRLEQKANLFVTPRMLRYFYEREKGRFVAPAAARLVQVRFTGAQAETSAQQAAALWQSEDLTPRALADRFPGAIALLELDASELATDFQAVVDFARAGPVGAVSAPVAAGNAFVVAKVTAHRPARNGRFQDEWVQQELRRVCEEGVRLEFERYALVRAQDRTDIWLSSLLR